MYCIRSLQRRYCSAKPGCLPQDFSCNGKKFYLRGKQSHFKRSLKGRVICLQGTSQCFNYEELAAKNLTGFVFYGFPKGLEQWVIRQMSLNRINEGIGVDIN